MTATRAPYTRLADHLVAEIADWAEADDMPPTHVLCALTETMTRAIAAQFRDPAERRAALKTAAELLLDAAANGPRTRSLTS